MVHETPTPPSEIIPPVMMSSASVRVDHVIIHLIFFLIVYYLPLSMQLLYELQTQRSNVRTLCCKGLGKQMGSMGNNGT